MEADSTFFDWLAGFIDGEGCFSITEDKRNGLFYPRFQLGVRDDDDAVIAEIHRRTGIGYQAHRKVAPGGEAKGWGGTAFWIIASKADCAGLIEILNKHPLRAKKARDYEIWRTAVIEWCAGSPKRMRALKRGLEKIREYRTDGLVLGVIVSPHLPQDALFEEAR